MEKNKKKNFTNNKSYLTMLVAMILGLLVIFSYVYQSTKQVYLNYEIVKLNDEISNLNIKLNEAEIENQRLQTNEAIERAASEKLGMSYEKTDKVIVIKETAKTENAKNTDDNIKIKIFINSLYEETNKILKQFNVKNIVNYFKGN